VGLFNRGKTIEKLSTELLELKDLNVQIVQNFQRSNIFDLSRKYVNQNIAQYPSWDLKKQTRRFCTTDDVYSIISLRAQTAALVPLYSYQVTDEKAYKRISQKGYDPRAIILTKQLQTKALTDLPETDKLYQLLENPHLVLSKFEFLEAVYTLLPMQGECILYKIRSEFGVNEGLPIKLEILESENVVKRISGFPHQVTSYDYLENGVTIMKDIPPEDIIHIKYFKCISPLQALHNRMARMDSEMDVSVAQLQNGGVPGVLYDENDDGGTVPTSDGGEMSIADARRINFYKYLQNKANKGSPAMMAGKLGYIALGLKLADMDVEALSTIDFKKLCNAFKVSDRLFNNDATGSEVSDDNAQKALYTRACLPDVYRVRDAFIAGLVPDFAKDGKKRTIMEDISEIPALQGDMLKMAQAYAALPSFVPNEMREMFHLEKSTDPNADKTYIKTGYVALEDLQGSQDLPLTADYNKP
jgi:phage portal protein BeeE